MHNVTHQQFKFIVTSVIYKNSLKEQIKNASIKCREESLNIKREFEELDSDGLDNL